MWSKVGVSDLSSAAHCIKFLETIVYNPVNLTLSVILVYLLLSFLLQPDPHSVLLTPTVGQARRLEPSVSYSMLPAEHPKTNVWSKYTPRTLAIYDGTGKYDGRDGSTILLAINGKVFDVTTGRNFYGPGGPYGNFAGRDASRGMAKQSFAIGAFWARSEDDADCAEMLTPLDQPLDKLEDLTGPER